MTSYRIEAGYNSAHQTSEVEKKLKEVTEEICQHPEVLLLEAKRVEGEVVPMSYAENYRLPWRDSTIRFLEDTPETTSRFPFSVYQMASGGGIEREYKEAMRRAFCRLVIEAMHKEGMEVSMVVG